MRGLLTISVLSMQRPIPFPKEAHYYKILAFWLFTWME